MKKVRGFTLIELMIVVVILAILAALAITAYTKQVRKSKRAEAKQVLSDLGLKQETWRTNHATYGSLADLGGAPTTGYYTIALTGGSNTATGYIFTAVPSGDQAKDTCGTLTWTMSLGVVTKAPTTPGCW
jgi:type IV pilus assembly protein PilE